MIKKTKKNNNIFYKIDKIDLTDEEFANELYKAFNDVVEKIVSIKTSVYINLIPSYEFDDIQQEMRIIALIALSKFDLSKVKSEKNIYKSEDIEADIYRFLSVTIPRRILNLKRDQFCYIEFPCISRKCKDYSGDRENPCESICKKYHQYEKYVNNKQKVLVPQSFTEGSSNVREDIISNDNLLLGVMMNEAVKNNTVDLKKYLNRGEISQFKKAKIKQQLKEYFSESQDTADGR